MNIVQNFLPELFLTLSVLGAILTSAFASFKRGSILSYRLLYLGLCGTFLMLFLIPTPDYFIFTKGLLLASSLVCLAYGIDWLKYKKFARNEYYALLGFSVLGMMICISADNFLLLFLGLELAQIPLYFMVAYKRQGLRSTQAGAKYILVGFLSTGFFLFGVSVIYLSTGIFDFSSLSHFDKTPILQVFLVGVSFVSVGLLLKLGVAPFHVWFADVLEGAPTPVTAFMSLPLRLCLIFVLVRVVLEPFSGLDFYWTPVLTSVSALCVLIGSFECFVQTNIKRLVAYTLLCSNGFIMMSLMDNDVSALMFYLCVDTVLMLGMMGLVLSLRVGGDLSEEIDVLSGQARAYPVRGALFSLVFLGLTGLPPFAGFWSRLFLFQESMQQSRIALSVILMLGSIVLSYVYLKLVRQIYFAPYKTELLPAPRPMKLMIWTTSIVSLLMLVGVSRLWQIAQHIHLFLGK